VLRYRNVTGRRHVFSISVIDVLQKFDFRKRLESYYKQLITRDADLISCVDAEQYSQRFLAFMNSVIIAVL
jgi:hypothetical protein